jgi:EAL domain-containing protein (putative c-di-GMP-specific phosphodiesterase class I)
MNALTNKLIGMEALVRWEHKSMGLVYPDKFIPLAEDTGMIIEIDQLVMKTALQQINSWYKEGLNPGVLSLNLSMKQLKEKNFINLIEDNLTKYSFNPKCLGLEITEGYVMQDPEEAIIKLKKLSNMGIKIAIDDFGTGYSSLSYLQRLPIKTLKIDQSFIRDITEDEEDTTVVKSIIALAKSLNMDVIAEGVETDKQLSFLLKNKCHNIQGYYYAKPMPADEMKIYMEKIL